MNLPASGVQDTPVQFVMVDIPVKPRPPRRTWLVRLYYDGVYIHSARQKQADPTLLFCILV